MDLGFEDRMPLGDLMQGVSEELDRQVEAWLRNRNVELPSAGTKYGQAPWRLTPAARDVLKNYCLARFALSVAGKLDYHAGESLNWAREYGATYTELGQAIGLPRQSVQRKWGIRLFEREAALNAIAAAVATLDPPAGLPDVVWLPTPMEDNYDPEAEVSAAQVSIEGGTGGSPNQVLLFRKGEYIGPATDQALGYTRFLQAMSKDKMIAIEFKIPGSPAAGPAEALYTARFGYRDGALVWFGELPPNVTSSIAKRGY